VKVSRREALLAAGAVVAGSPTNQTKSTTPTQTSLPDFAGKTLVVQTRNRPLSNPIILNECELQTQAGKLFLTGVRQACAPELSSWTDGVRCYVAWDDVEEYLVFQSVQDFHSRLCRPEPCSTPVFTETPHE
jgi:hypothetical protein